MTAHEIFTKLSDHMIKGLMVHEQFANYYDFLNLKGYRLEQEHQYIEESRSYRRLYSYYINHFNKLIESGKIEDPKIIPESWYKHTRFDVDSSTKRKAVENGFSEWKKWEEKTHSFYCEMYKELIEINDISSAIFLEKLIKDVSTELYKINQTILLLKSSEYSIDYINDQQDILCMQYEKED